MKRRPTEVLARHTLPLPDTQYLFLCLTTILIHRWRSAQNGMQLAQLGDWPAKGALLSRYIDDGLIA
jgi:hypothetical protein